MLMILSMMMLMTMTTLTMMMTSAVYSMGCCHAQDDHSVQKHQTLTTDSAHCTGDDDVSEMQKSIWKAQMQSWPL